MEGYLRENPDAYKNLEQYGFDIQKRYAKKKRGPTHIERDEGINVLGGNFLQQQKKQTAEVDVDPNLLIAANKAFVRDTLESTKGYTNAQLEQMADIYKGLTGADKQAMKEQFQQKGILRQIVGKMNVQRVLTDEADKFLRENFQTMSDKEIADVFNADLEKYSLSGKPYTVRGIESNRLRRN